MSTLEVSALALAGAWLATLTVVILLLVRQVGLVTVRLDVTTQALGSPYDDGLAIGTEVPEAARSLIPISDGQRTYLLFLSATCQPCRELAAGLEGEPIGQPVVAIVSGADDRADALVALLPADIQVVRDPAATEVANSMRVRTMPFALEIEEGAISGKAILGYASDLTRLVEARSGAYDSRAASGSKG